VDLVEQGNGPAVRLLIASNGDPRNERAFSGSLRALCDALARRGVVHHTANVSGRNDAFVRRSLPVRAFQKLDPFHLIERYRWSRMAFRMNSMRAQRAARTQPGFNACLMYGTAFNSQLDVPTYCYLDATSAQIYKARQWEFRWFSARKAQSVIDYQREVFHMCTGIFPRTGWVGDSVINDFGVPPEKIHVATAGPNYTLEPAPHGPYDAQRILFIGRDFERKGGPLILEAFRLTRAALPSAKLVIVGCEVAVDEPGVEVMGVIKKDAPGGLDRLLDLYRHASVFCMMSHYEPFGIVVIEAQDCYVPCVVPRRFAFPEMVLDGVTGRCVEEYDARVLADTLIELLSDPVRLEAMGRAGHDHVRANYTWDKAAERIYQQIQRDLAARRT